MWRQKNHAIRCANQHAGCDQDGEDNKRYTFQMSLPLHPNISISAFVKTPNQLARDDTLLICRHSESTRYYHHVASCVWSGWPSSVSTCRYTIGKLRSVRPRPRQVSKSKRRDISGSRMWCFRDVSGVMQRSKKRRVEYYTEKNTNRSGQDCRCRDLVNHTLDPSAVTLRLIAII